MLFGFVAVRKIDVGGQCSETDVCADDSAECVRGACRCVGDYTQMATHCGMIYM